MTAVQQAGVEPSDHQPKGVQGGDPRALQIQLLGAFRVAIGSRVIEDAAWRLRKAASLVKLLALAPGHRLHREQVMDALWPDLDPAAATNNLHYTLHAARRVVDSGAAFPRAAASLLRLQQGVLSLEAAGSLIVDVEAFEAAVATARRTQETTAYHTAIDLYTGDLLPEDRYEDWATSRRETLRATYLALLVEVAQLHETRGDYQPAIQALQRVVEHEPAHEEAHIGLMRLFALTGQRHQALRQYQHLRDVLCRELDAEPDAPTQRLYQEILEGRFPTTEPPPASRLTPPAPQVRQHNLPVALSSFIGREQEIAEVKRLLGTTRLLTLTGAGGSGKTRLALRVATGLVDAYPAGVWLVELAGLADPTLVPQTVAAVLGVREEAQRPLMDTLTDALQTKVMLLVLDNCEHLIDACAHLTAKLLATCAHLQILATSREALRVPGEMTWRMPSLGLPDARRLPQIEDVSQFEAVHLFLDRARLRQPTFALTPENAPAVVEICRRLDGMPLAIELAAARVGMLAVEQIAMRLDDALRLLTGGSRTAIPRQQTLRATLEWSYALLTRQERRLFHRLAVFASGWTLEAAEAVCVTEGIEQHEVVDLVAQLVDKSLVQVEEQGGAVRYRLLETIRQYAWARLIANREDAAIAQRHAAYYLLLAEQAEPALEGPQQRTWLERLEEEHDNLHAALQWSLDHREVELTLRFTGALGGFWYRHSHLSEGRHWLERALALAGVRGQQMEAGSWQTRTPDPRPPVRGPHVAKALSGAAWLAQLQGDYRQAIAWFAESLALWRQVGDKRGIAYALHGLGLLNQYQHAHEQAAALYEESLQLRREMNDKVGIAVSLNVLGLLAGEQGNYAGARALYEESLSLAREMGNKASIATSLIGLGHARSYQGDHARARSLYKESLALSQELGDKKKIADCIAGLAGVAGAQGHAERAARLLGAVEGLRAAIGVPLPPADHSRYEQTITAARAQLDQLAFGAARAKGRAMSVDEAIAEAMRDVDEDEAAIRTAREAAQE